MESPYSPFQLEMLEAACVSSGYSIPPLGIRKRLANDLGLSDAKVRYWFSDRAEKDKDSTSNPCYGSGQRYCGKSTFLSFVSTEYGGVCTTSRREEAAPKLEVSKKQERMDAIHKFHERAKEVFASRVAIEVELDHKVFGQTVNVLIQMTLEDIEFICTPYEWLSNNAIVLYIRVSQALARELDFKTSKEKVSWVDVKMFKSGMKYGMPKIDEVRKEWIDYVSPIIEKCGDVCVARKVFDAITERDLVSWNSMISGYSKMGCSREAVGLFKEMRMKGCEPNEMSVVSVLGACGDLGDLSFGKLLEGLVVEKGFELNTFVGSSLINMFGKCGDLESARRIFDRMPVKKDSIPWNAMITGQVSVPYLQLYAQNGAADEAIALFHDMISARAEANKITLSAVLSACASVGAIDLGKWVEEYSSKKGYLHDVYIATALVDMYAKCGSINQAHQIFKNMPSKNVVSWNAMISALAVHGRAQDAIALFKSMLKDGTVCPDDITFVGVLSACVHVGLVEEGCQWFDLMGPTFGLIPKVEHYSCVVDLLARSGNLEEAWNFIEKMPEKPDAVMLGALLGACKTRGNVEIGERVVSLLIDLEPANSGNYIISAKMYANSKKWDDSARMRGLMREKGVSKTPGVSWIDIESQLHEFHAGEICLASNGISQVFNSLNEEMKFEGYVPNTSYL
ncbi:hypothetical protein C5167_025674 [Papaver somniferum]|uniref:Homeobox domain-containing protein n=1 Tax=Papaver somniferum TaxID=3469 RepID=A0A4Y7JT87_PAPSO|nr:hypothetical protein C5167_025674 [Papaver somniferum]